MKMRAFVIFFALATMGVAADVSGVGNFHQINDHLYRGAQPTPDGFDHLAQLGIKTVIDLREAGPRAVAEKKIVEKDGMHYINIPFAGFSAPTDKQVTQVLAIFNDPGVGPVFVHCRRGADRTGTVVACYRVACEHWKNQDALAEAKKNGMAWIERAMRQYVLNYHPSDAVAAAAATYSSTRSQ